MPDLYLDVDTALAEVPVNILPLIDDSDFKSRKTAIAYNAAGMDLVWNFVTTAGAMTQTAVTPTSGGDYDWAHQGDGMYSIEIPASGGASINNDTEGFGWFTGVATGVLPWRGPVIGFRHSALNDSLLDAGTTGVLAPTTAGRTLDVTAGGEAGIDWANIGSPTTAVNLSGTNIDVDQVVASVSGAVGSVTGNVGGNVTGSVGSVAAGGIAAASFAAGAIDASAIAASAIGASELANGAITSAKFAAGAIDAAATANDFLAEVNAEVVDALNVDTYAEPGQGNPAATASLVTKIGFVYKAWRNRHTQTATEYALYADDGTTKDQEAAVSDDGVTLVRGEVQTGA